MLVAIVAAGVVIAIVTIASTKSKDVDADEYVYSRRDGFKPPEYGYRLPEGSWGFGYGSKEDAAWAAEQAIERK